MLQACKILLLSFIFGSISYAQNFDTQRIEIPAKVGYVSNKDGPIIDIFEVKMNPKVFEGTTIVELNSESKRIWEHIVSCHGSEGAAREAYRKGQICAAAKTSLTNLKQKVEMYLASAYGFGPMFTIDCISAYEVNCKSALKILKEEMTDNDVPFINIYGHEIFFQLMKPFGIHPLFNQIMLENVASQRTLLPLMKMCNDFLCTDKNATYWMESVGESMMKYYINRAMNYEDIETTPHVTSFDKEQVVRKYNDRLKKEDQLTYSEIESKFRKSLMAYRILSLSLAGKTDCSTWTLFPKEAFDFFQFGEKVYNFSTFEHKLIQTRIMKSCGFSENREQANYQDYLKRTGKAFIASGYFLGTYVDKAETTLEFWKKLK